MLFDIHSHILPGVDDGSQFFDTSIQMIEEEIKNGVTDVILTPHFRYGKIGQLSKQDLIEAFQEFKEKVKDYPINLYLGSEIMLHGDFLEGMRKNEIISMNNSKYVLIEFNFGEDPLMIYEKTFNVTCLGYTPIIAHLERYVNFNLELAHSLKKLGALIQVNTTSIDGNFGNVIKKNAFALLKNKLVDFIASDAHSMRTRKPNLKNTLEFVKKKFKQEFTNELKNFDKPFIYQEN